MATSTSDWLSYSNQNATRNQPISAELRDALSFLPDMGVSVNVYSGGQSATGSNRTGSTRHNHGNAADVMFVKDGRVLDWNNPSDLPLLSDIVSRARANGITGIGAGDDYMGAGRFHVGFGTPAVWGAKGRSANAPEWLRNAYYATPTPPAAVGAINRATSQPPKKQGANGGLIANALNFGRGLIGAAQQNVVPAVQRAASIAPLMGSISGRTALMNMIMPSNIGAAPTVSTNMSGAGTPAMAINAGGSSPVMLIGSGYGSNAPSQTPGAMDMNVYRANREAIGGPITTNSIASALSGGSTLYSSGMSNGTSSVEDRVRGGPSTYSGAR